MSKTVALFFSDKDRYFNVKQALDLIKQDIVQSLENKKQIILKPNLVNEYYAYGSTHKHTLQAVIDFIQENKIDSEIIIAEDTAVGNTWLAMYKQGYFDLEFKKPIKFKNIKFDERVKIQLFNRHLQKTLAQHVSQTLANAEYLVSLAIPKTHDSVVVTLSLKNIFVGSLLEKMGRGKRTIHQGYPAINLCLAELANFVYPNLSIIDGWISMEGQGPSHGNPVNTHFAGCSLDPLKLDLIIAQIMGFKIKDIGYLEILRQRRGIDIDKIKVDSNVKNWRDKIIQFKPHPDYKKQILWQN